MFYKNFNILSEIKTEHTHRSVFHILSYLILKKSSEECTNCNGISQTRQGYSPSPDMCQQSQGTAQGSLPSSLTLTSFGTSLGSTWWGKQLKLHIIQHTSNSFSALIADIQTPYYSLPALDNCFHLGEYLKWTLLWPLECALARIGGY